MVQEVWLPLSRVFLLPLSHCSHVSTHQPNCIETLATEFPTHHMQVIGSNKHNRFMTTYFKFLWNKGKGKVKFLVPSFSRLVCEALAVKLLLLHFFFTKAYIKRHFLCETLIYFLRPSPFLNFPFLWLPVISKYICLLTFYILLSVFLVLCQIVNCVGAKTVFFRQS